MDHEEFLGAVVAWAATNEEQIKSKWVQKGGWEGWVQGEIFSFVVKNNPSVNIQREHPVYTSTRKAADFVLNDNGNASQKVIVELKAQSWNNRKNFVPELEKDTKKLIKELHSRYNGSTLLVVGLYFTDEIEIPNYFSKKTIGTGEIGICWAIDQNS
jgi:hypothetical protein